MVLRQVLGSQPVTPATAALQLSPRTRYVTAPYASNDGKGGAVLTAGSLPPDCTAAVAVSGSHTCRRVARLVRTKLSLQAHRFC